MTAWLACARSVAAVVSVFATISIGASRAAEAGPVVTIKAGALEGVAANGVQSFKGIPYAAPPVGDLRWRDPAEPTPWTGTRKADAYGFSCLQKVFDDNGMTPGDLGPMSEDCLYLNVWTPEARAGAKLPVMVWIHGGAFVIGASNFAMTDGSNLAKRGAVVVSFNYRLGQLGFFAHPSLGPVTDKTTANFGLMDQIAALKWVKRNIAQFGGDPANVTIFGESAGAKSVAAMFASPKARGLFHKGIAQSTYAVPDMTSAKALEMGANVATAAGLPGKDATADQLRALPADAFSKLEGQGLTSSPVPIAGDKVLPRTIEAIFKSGDEAAVPLIIGDNSDDASVALAFGVKPEDVLEKIKAAGFVAKLLYPGVNDEAERARQATRDLIFTMLARWTADRHAKRALTWRYYFDYTAEKLRPKFPNGVPHGSEIVYTFDNVDVFEGTKPHATAADRAYSKTVGDYWFNFARTGRPFAKGEPFWEPHRAGADRTIIFEPSIRAERNFMRPRLNIMIGLTKIISSVMKPR